MSSAAMAHLLPLGGSEAPPRTSSNGRSRSPEPPPAPQRDKDFSAVIAPARAPNEEPSAEPTTLFPAALARPVARSSTGNGWPPPSGRWPRPARGSTAWPASHHGSRRLRVPLLPAASYRREPGVAVRGVRCDFRRPLMAPIDRPSRPRERAHMPAVGPTASLLALAGHVCRVVASLAKAFSIAEASRSYGAGSPMMPRRVVRLIDRCPKPSIDSRGNT